jgi:hypothetical protein
VDSPSDALAIALLGCGEDARRGSTYGVCKVGVANPSSGVFGGGMFGMWIESPRNSGESNCEEPSRRGRKALGRQTLWKAGQRFIDFLDSVPKPHDRSGSCGDFYTSSGCRMMVPKVVRIRGREARSGCRVDMSPGFTPKPRQQDPLDHKLASLQPPRPLLQPRITSVPSSPRVRIAC